MRSMTLADFANWPQPDGNAPDAVPAALRALGLAHDAASSLEAYDRFLWAIGNNHAGTYHPVVLAALPALHEILRNGHPWARHAALQSLIDLDGPFVPEAGFELHDGLPVQPALRAAIQAMRPEVARLADAAEDLVAAAAAELLDTIDDLAR